MLNAYKNKRLYLLIMTFGVMINICLFFAFKYYGLLQLNTNDIANTMIDLILQIAIYSFIMIELNSFCKRLFIKSKLTQEEIFFDSFGSLLTLGETLIFDYKLSDNQEISKKQQKLINQIIIFKRIRKIFYISLFLLTCFLTQCRTYKENNILKYFGRGLLLLYFFISCLLYNFVVKKQALDEKDVNNQNQENKNS